MNYSIAIIGSREAILGFRALGVETATVKNVKEATEKLFELKKTKQIVDDQETEIAKFAIIFITEDLAQQISRDDYKKLSIGALPAIIPIPSHKGATGFGLTKLRRIVEQAVGSDIMG